MSTKTARLNELIEVTRDGERFYLHAAEEVRDPLQQELFTELAADKSRTIRALAMQVAAHQERPAQGGTLIGALRELYADTRANFSPDQAAAYADQLERAEARILQAFEDVRADADPELLAIIDAELPRLRASHARILDLKQRMS